MNNAPVETAAVVNAIPAMRSFPGQPAHVPGVGARLGAEVFFAFGVVTAASFFVGAIGPTGLRTPHTARAPKRGSARVAP